MIDTKNIIKVLKDDKKNIITPTHIKLFKERYYQKEQKQIERDIIKGEKYKGILAISFIDSLILLILLFFQFIFPSSIAMIFVGFTIITSFILIICTYSIFEPKINYYFNIKSKNDISFKDILVHQLYNDEDFQDIFNNDFIQFSKLISKYSYKERKSVLEFIEKNVNSENLIKYINLAKSENVELSLEFMKQIDKEKLPIINATNDALIKIMPIFDFYKMNNVDSLIDINYDDYNFIKDNKDNYNLSNSEFHIRKFNDICNRFYQANNGKTDKINTLLRLDKVFKSNQLSDQHINEKFNYFKENFQFISIIDLNQLEYDIAQIINKQK